jgi:DNA (cytosine-5)-methyltransferase 1
MARRVLSLFTGIGGLDLGLEAAGFHTAVAVEMDLDAVGVVRKNRDWPVVADGERPKPIEAISSSELLSVARLTGGEPDLLVGGPPCQPFSKAGYWASGDSRRLKDPRANTLAEYLRVLRETQPRAFLLERRAANIPFRSRS